MIQESRSSSTCSRMHHRAIKKNICKGYKEEVLKIIGIGGIRGCIYVRVYLHVCICMCVSLVSLYACLFAKLYSPFGTNSRDNSLVVTVVMKMYLRLSSHAPLSSLLTKPSPLPRSHPLLSSPPLIPPPNSPQPPFSSAILNNIHDPRIHPLTRHEPPHRILRRALRVLRRSTRQRRRPSIIHPRRIIRIAARMHPRVAS